MDYIFSKDRDFRIDNQSEDQIDYNKWISILNKIDRLTWNRDTYSFSERFRRQDMPLTAYIDFSEWCEVIFVEEPLSPNNSSGVYDYTLMFYYDLNRKFGLARFPNAVDKSYLPLMLDISRQLDCYLLRLPKNCNGKNKIITEKSIRL